MTVNHIAEGIAENIDSGTGIDYQLLINGMEFMSSLVDSFIRLLVGIIIVGLPLVIAIEVMYINFPIIQSKYDDLYHRLQGKSQKAFGLIIRDARKAVEDSHTIKYGASANRLYLSRKIPAIFICTFLVAMVLGPTEVIIKYAMGIINNMVDALKLSINKIM